MLADVSNECHVASLVQGGIILSNSSKFVDPIYCREYLTPTAKPRAISLSPRDNMHNCMRSQTLPRRMGNTLSVTTVTRSCTFSTEISITVWAGNYTPTSAYSIQFKTLLSNEMKQSSVSMVLRRMVF